jgi:alcohol dehydrogenase
MKQLAIRLFQINPTGKTDRQIAEEGLDRLRQFWNEIGAPNRLADYGIDELHLEAMAEKAVKPGNGTTGRFKPLYKEDVYQILQMSL